MARIWLIIMVCVLCVSSGSASAAKPVRPPPEPAVPAPNVFSVKIDYRNGFVIVEGENLDPASATATFSGVALSPAPASSDTALQFPFTIELSAVVNEMGNYVLMITNDGGSFTLSTFIPIALNIPPDPPPPGELCPCSTEWDSASATPSPDGFAGLTPYCSEESADWITVQVYDAPANNYWVMWTDWDAGSGSGFCELYIDGPNRSLDTEEQFNACANYLRDIVTVWGNQGNTCLF